MMSIRKLAPLVLVGSLAYASAGFGADKAGSADYPDVGRFEGSEIEFYATENYGETTLATGPVLKVSDAEYHCDDRSKVASRESSYKVPRGSSPLEVFRNFENRVAEAGISGDLLGWTRSDQ